MTEGPTRAARRHVAKTTTYGIVARDAPTVIVFRRGPTRHIQLLRWDLRDDTVLAGQWLVAGLDPGPCGVSPNGELLVYDARKGANTYTAISRPPYFTALAYLPYSSPWTGGGFFTSDRSIVLGHRYVDADIAGRFPEGFAITDVWTHFASAAGAASRISVVVGETPDANHGWSMTERGSPRKPNPRRPSLVLERTRSARSQRAYTVVAEGPPRIRHELGAVDWADWGHDGSLLVGKTGGLYRTTLPRSLADADDVPLVLVADLTGNTFEDVPPPAAALEWPASRSKLRR